MQDSLESQILEAFQTNEEYFRVIRDFHCGHGSVAIDAEEKDMIERFMGSHVLDAGCGEGSIARWFAGKYSKISVVGVDCSSVALSMARAASSGNSLGRLNWAEASIKSLPFVSSAFDLVLCHAVLEHVVDYPAGLQELARVLRPGGRLIIRTANSGRLEIGAVRALLKLLSRKTRESALYPTLIQRAGSVEDNQENFDVTHIWSNVIARHLKRLGFRILHFTTQRAAVWHSPIYEESGSLRRLVTKIVYTLPFYPFTHLGPNILVACEKIGTNAFSSR